MGRFKLKVEYSHFFEVRDQYHILNLAFGPGGINRWATAPIYSTAYTDRYSKKITDAAWAVVYFRSVHCTEKATGSTYYISTWHMYNGMAQFCIQHDMKPDQLMSIMSPSVADQIIQLGIFHQIKY